MKIKVSQIIELIIELSCILMFGFLLIPQNDIIGYNTSRILVGVWSIISTLLVIKLTYKDKQFRKINCILNRYFIPYTLIIFLMAIYSYYTYRFALWDLLLIFIPYLYAYLAYAIAYVFYKQKSMEKMMDKISILVVIILVFKAYAWYQYNFKGEIVFERLLFEYDDWFRNGMQRVNAGYLVGIASVFLLCKQTKGISWIVYRLAVGFIVLFLMYVTAFRYQLIVTLFTCFVVYYFYKGGQKKQLIKRMALIGVVVYFLTSEQVQNLISSFAISGSDIGYSTLVRLMNVEHYGKLMWNKFAIFGIGFISKASPTALSLMSYGNGKIFWLEDIGILGGFFRFGVMAVFIYGYLFKHAISDCLKLLKCNTQIRTIMFGITAYMITSCVMLNIFDGQRAFDVPFYIAIIAYVEGVFLNKNRKNPML